MKGTISRIARPRSSFVSPVLFAIFLLCAAAPGQAQRGRLVREVVHGVSLEKNVTGDSPDRPVSIYLPPSYDSSPQKRYPVVYVLHGIGDTDEQWIRPWDEDDDWGTVQDVMDRGIADGRLSEMIVVIPDQRTRIGGSFYSNSAASGNWEDFTVKDLVGFVDSKYRTLARASSRGITGHSMGAHGAIKLGMKHPDVFSVVYGMNPAVLGWGQDLSIDNPAFQRALTATPENMRNHGFYVPAILCLGQAFSPNPGKPPFFADLPFALSTGRLEPLEPAFGKWEENMPLYIVRNYRENLTKLRALRFDAGAEDQFTHIPQTARQFSQRLTSLGIPHVFEEYNGDHRNRLWGRSGRINNAVFPYFSQKLERE